MKKKIFAIAAAMIAAVTTMSTTVFAEEATTAAETVSEAAAEGNNNWWIMLIVYAAVIAGAYFFLFRPQSKKKKKEAALRKNAQIGDEITTIGGISGRIVAIKEESDMLILETGSDRHRINVKRWAISTVDTQSAPPADINTKNLKEAKHAKKEETPEEN